MSRLDADAVTWEPLPACPICGSRTEAAPDDPQEPEMFWHWTCGCSQLGCPAYGRYSKSFASRDEAIENWRSYVRGCS